MPMLDLSRMLESGVDVLLGYDYGVRARRELGLDDLDHSAEPVVVPFPEHLDTIAPSFAQGFFGKSVLAHDGRDGFYRAYDFSDWPEDLQLQIDAGVARVLMDRPAVAAA